MRRIGLWFALATMLVLVNVAVFVWRTPSPSPSQPAAASSALTAPTSELAREDAAVDPDIAPLPTTQAPNPAVPVGAPAAPPASDVHPPTLLLPVQGIDIAEVHDTFDDARGSERVHEALDVMAPAGTPVLAAADGRIEKLFSSDRGGLTIYQFDPSGTWSYYYAHLQAYAPGLAEGMQVRRGDVLGTVGSTGNADPAAPHLHFAVFRLTPERQWWTGTPVNPWPLLARDP